MIFLLTFSKNIVKLRVLEHYDIYRLNHKEDYMKLAFIGTGKIIEDALYAMKPIESIEKVAIFARPHSREKAEAFAADYGMTEIFTDYASLLEESSCDTVYIGLINSAHYPYAKEALLHGKNVILEKPFTGFAKEARELQQIAEEKKLFILEAVTVLHNEVFYEMKKNLSKLGPMRMMLCNYSQYSSRYDDYLAGNITHSFDKDYYGGALYDINVYNIHYCVGLFGAPKDAIYYPNIGPNGIDTSGTLILTYDDFTATCTGSKDSDSPGYITVQGEKGFMKIDSKPNIASELITTYVDASTTEKVKDAAGAMVRATITETYKAPEVHHRMTQEFTDFARIIDEKDYETAHNLLSESVTVVEVLEKARTAAGIEF